MNWPTSCLENGSVATLNCIPPLFQLILNALFQFAGIVALFFVIFSGIKFLTSGGDEKKIEEARKTLTFAIIGLVLILIAIPIVNFIANIVDPSLKNCLLNFGLLHC